jgi:hypothetical protein
MDDFLLFVHVLAAFLLVAAVVPYTAYALGWAPPAHGMTISNRLWDLGALGTLVFGIWLALRQDAYDFFDGWIIAALVLWAAAMYSDMNARAAGHATGWHWMRVVLTIAILVVMVYKPGV